MSDSVKTIYVDIDDTICYTNKTDYANSIPYEDRINKINDLYDQGNTIVYWTARGTLTGLDHTDLTKRQLKDWGVKYTKLILGKPYYDLFIDDKNINSETYFNASEN